MPGASGICAGQRSRWAGVSLTPARSRPRGAWSGVPVQIGVDVSTHTPESSHTERPERVTNRRRFIAGAGLTGLTVLGVGSLSAAPAAFGAGNLSTGDAAILRFLAAAEILETDLWQQYNELCGIQDHEVPHGTGNKAFTKALSQLDS